MHGLDRFAQALIGEAQQDSTVDKPRLHGGPKEKDENVFEETIEGSLPAWRIGEGFGEE
jgi:hypothetical protein